MRLLLAEDEKELSDALVAILKHANYTVDAVYDGEEALDYLDTGVYDGVILDIMMPKLDGFSACKQIRAIRPVPVIMLSARQEEYDKLFGFELGVDDYVVKPFSPKELMARVKVVLDRTRRTDNSIMNFGGLRIDAAGRSVTVDGEKANLTPKEIDLLLYLVEHRNTALSRTKLLEEVWNYDYFGDDRTVDTHIKMLRHNLGPYRDYIVTVRGMGYKFEA